MRTHSLHPLATAGEGLLAGEVKDQAEQRRLAPLERRRVRLWFKLVSQLHGATRASHHFLTGLHQHLLPRRVDDVELLQGRSKLLSRGTRHTYLALSLRMQVAKRSRKGWERRIAARTAHTQPLSSFNVVKG